MAKKTKTVSRRKPEPVYQETSFSIPMPQVMRERPLDSFALFMAGSAAIAIVFNAIWLQDGAPGQRRVAAPQPAAAAAPAAPAPAPAAQTSATPQSDAPSDIAALAAAATGTQGSTAQAPATQRSEDPNLLVREVQTELARRGLYDGPADGIFGPKTEAAIFDFEIGAGLKPTGRPNPQLVAAMRAKSAPVVVSSPRVAAVQKALDQQGFGPVKADGVAGEGTRASIRRFEASRGLPQKGEITPALLRELSRVSGVSFD